MEKDQSIMDMAQSGDFKPMDAPPVLNKEKMLESVKASETIDAPQTNVDSDILTNLLAKVQGKKEWVSVNLPSGGHAYNGVATVKIRPFNFQDELDLKNLQGDVTAGISQVISRCVEGVPGEYLTLPDRDYLLFKLRELTWGNIYPMESTCTNKECGKINKLQIDLETLPVKYAQENLNTITLKLPDSETTVVARHPAVKDEMHTGSINDMYMNLHRFILSVDEVTDSKIIFAFLQGTTLRDVDTVHNSVYGSDYGMEKMVIFQCNACHQDNQIALGLSKDFFTPN